MALNLKSDFKRGDMFLVGDINKTNSAINQLSKEVDNIKNKLAQTNPGVDSNFVNTEIDKKMFNFSAKLDEQINSINVLLTELQAQININRTQLSQLSEKTNISKFDNRVSNLENSIAIINEQLYQLNNSETSIETANNQENSNENKQETVFGYKQIDYSCNGMTSLTIYPYNRTFLYGEIDGEFEFVKGAGSYNFLSDEYIVIFTAGKNCKITFSPAFGNIKWENGKPPTYTQGYTYEIKIANSLASVKKYK